MHTIQITFKIWNRVQFGQAIYLIGSTPQLGQWNVHNSVRLQWQEGDIWIVDILIPWENQQRIEYKYMVSDYKNPQIFYWEKGPNRNILLKPENIMRQQSPFFYILRDDKWQQRKIIIKLIENNQKDNNNKNSLQNCMTSNSGIKSPINNQDQSSVKPNTLCFIENMQNEEEDIKQQFSTLNSIQNQTQLQLQQQNNIRQKNHTNYYQNHSRKLNYQVQFYLKGNISQFQNNQTQVLIKMQKKMRNQTQEISQNDIVSPDVLHTLQNYHLQKQQSQPQTQKMAQNANQNKYYHNSTNIQNQTKKQNNNQQFQKSNTSHIDDDINQLTLKKNQNSVQQQHQNHIQQQLLQQQQQQNLSQQQQQQQCKQQESENQYWYQGEAWIDITVYDKLKYCFIKEIITEAQQQQNQIYSVGIEANCHKSYLYTDRQIRKIDIASYFENHDKLVLVNQQTIFDFKFSQIDENLFLGPYPQGEQDIQKLKESGIQAVLNLQTEEDMQWRGISWEQQQQEYQKNNIKGYNFPIIDMDYQDMSAKLIQVSQLLHLILQSYKYMFTVQLEYLDPHKPQLDIIVFFKNMMLTMQFNLLKKNTQFQKEIEQRLINQVPNSNTDKQNNNNQYLNLNNEKNQQNDNKVHDNNNKTLLNNKQNNQNIFSQYWQSQKQHSLNNMTNQEFETPKMMKATSNLIENYRRQQQRFEHINQNQDSQENCVNSN
ncbi:Carbohydrate-binding-like fold [Pseudocohnilembus persalinus]|uniref:Carbohydrate-binding-like fold n=1 Tax=Pseudocohnilembus persalinus TaxID=266149 RepID=A0A0V0QL05_PSEPJ|nr:Carbohydrate-binding-like fold [Pseudocohnilembus persalinus]|eukprot:KRX02916.1 Carbohydrate-binding-like fold [Pseudocohnilembus persalinus]